MSMSPPTTPHSTEVCVRPSDTAPPISMSHLISSIIESFISDSQTQADVPDQTNYRLAHFSRCPILSKSIPLTTHLISSNESYQSSSFTIQIMASLLPVILIGSLPSNSSIVDMTNETFLTGNVGAQRPSAASSFNKSALLRGIVQAALKELKKEKLRKSLQNPPPAGAKPRALAAAKVQPKAPKVPFDKRDPRRIEAHKKEAIKAQLREKALKRQQNHEHQTDGVFSRGQGPYYARWLPFIPKKDMTRWNAAKRTGESAMDEDSGELIPCGTYGGDHFDPPSYIDEIRAPRREQPQGPTVLEKQAQRQKVAAWLENQLRKEKYKQDPILREQCRREQYRRYQLQRLQMKKNPKASARYRYKSPHYGRLTPAQQRKERLQYFRKPSACYVQRKRQQLTRQAKYATEKAPMRANEMKLKWNPRQVRPNDLDRLVANRRQNQRRTETAFRPAKVAQASRIIKKNDPLAQIPLDMQRKLIRAYLAQLETEGQFRKKASLKRPAASRCNFAKESRNVPKDRRYPVYEPRRAHNDEETTDVVPFGSEPGINGFF